MDTHDPELAARANALYWESEAGVNEIAERLDLSKGALYGLIEPLDAGIDCPECSSPMEYPNRTALDKAMVTCGACGLEEEFALVEAAAGPPKAPAVDPPPPPAPRHSTRAGELAETTVPVRTLVASTLLALAAGYAIGQITGRR